jgi:FkbM family methyltransferase
MLTVSRHGQTLHFDVTGFSAMPYVYRPLVEGKLYEEAFLEYVRSLGKVGQYVDVGAHLGTHSLWFAKMCPATGVHAFEPVRRYAEVIRRNVAANSLEDKITVHQKGLAAANGQATNYLSTEHQVGFVDGRATAVTECFEVLRMDDVVQGPVALIKVDVEGMEPQVLEGATRILSQYRPLIFAEAQSRSAAKQLALQLAPLGYKPTWRVFNATPTYEFSTELDRGWKRSRRVYARLLPALCIGRRAATTLRRFFIADRTRAW